MHKFKVFNHLLFLAITPSLFVYPQDNLPKVVYEEQLIGHAPTYDEILHFLDEIESGELEKRSTPEDLERIKRFLAFLAKQGALPDGSEESLDEDIEDLLHGEDYLDENEFSVEAQGEYRYMIIPAVWSGGGEMILCKTWAEKQMKGFLMNNEKFKGYIIDAITLLKELARKAKVEADNPKEGSKDYAEGVIMGYYSIITLLKHQAFIFCIDQKELGLADIKPDIGLLGLHKNPDIDFGEDNWAIDVMNEEKIKGYLSDSIKLLKDQAIEAKKKADNPKEGFEDYNKGQVMAYHTVISTLKNQARFFDLKQEDIGLADIDPDEDLLGLHRRIDIDPE